VTNGTVSGFKMDAIGQDLMQTDAPAAHGNSGGPAIGDDAAVVGVMDFVSLSPEGVVLQGFNFLIPARGVRTFLQGTDVRPGDTPARHNVPTTSEYEPSPLRLPSSIRVEPDAVDRPDFTLDVAPAQMIVTYCTSPEEATSATVAQKLRERGFRRVRILKGGLGGWSNARLPVESKSALPSIGLEIYKNLTL